MSKSDVVARPQLFGGEPALVMWQQREMHHCLIHPCDPLDCHHEEGETWFEQKTRTKVAGIRCSRMQTGKTSTEEKRGRGGGGGGGLQCIQVHTVQPHLSKHNALESHKWYMARYQ